MEECDQLYFGLQSGRGIFQWRGTILSVIYKDVLGFMLLSFLIVTFAEDTGLTLPIADNLTPILTLVVGQLLAFRTSTAYERWQEGVKTWARVGMHTRTILRILLMSRSKLQDLDDEKLLLLRQLAEYLIVFSNAMKDKLRTVSLEQERREGRLPIGGQDGPDQMARMRDYATPPLPHDVLVAMQAHASLCSRNDILDKDDFNRLYLATNGIAEELAVTERILTNPMPSIYKVHLSQIVFLYLLFLPFQLALKLKYWTVILVGLAVFTFYGLEEMGNSIENPFGDDFSDLPMEKYCATIADEVNHLFPVVHTSLEPTPHDDLLRNTGQTAHRLEQAVEVHV